MPQPTTKPLPSWHGPCSTTSGSTACVCSRTERDTSHTTSHEESTRQGPTARFAARRRTKMLHMVILIFGVVLALSFCGIVGAILWLVVHRHQRLAAQDLIPLVGFTLSGLISFLIFTISTTISSTPQKEPPTGPAPHSLMTSPTPTATAPPHASATATAPPHASATATAPPHA